MSHDSGSIKIEVDSNGKTHRLLKLFFICKCADILQTLLRKCHSIHVNENHVPNKVGVANTH